MPVLGWSRSPVKREIRRIPADGVVYVISDLHLGDGTPSDTFLAKDRQLLALIDQINAEDATLVVAGDAIDFAQGWTFARILRAHGPVLRALSEMADRGRMIYIYGNHDHDLQLFQYVLRFPVVAGVELGDRALIQHGYEYDWLIGPDLKQSEINTLVHHMVERLLGAWIRPPIEHHYNLVNRFAFWLIHKAVWGTRAISTARRLLGDTQAGLRAEAELQYWLRSQLGDPGDMFRSVSRALAGGSHEVLISGHSHMPGVVELPGGRYVNTGSWTFNSSTTLRWDAGELSLTEWMTGREHGDALYRSLIDKTFDHVTFDDWWADNYMGWLRFRCGEERGARRPPWLDRQRAAAAARPALPSPDPRSSPTPRSSPAEVHLAPVAPDPDHRSAGK